MANYSTIKAAIQAAIKQNGDHEITGPIMQTALLAIIDSLGAGYQFMGVATPTTNPGTPDQKVMYIAGQAGAYSNFGNITIPVGVFGILKWDTEWSAQVLAITHPVDTSDNSDTNFDITDENGNAIVRFKDGHLQTKYFDSRQSGISQFDRRFVGKKIAIIGDSATAYGGYLPSNIAGYTGATYSASYPMGDVNSVSKMWWHIMAQHLGMSPLADINCCGWSGSKTTGDSESTSSAAAGCSTRRITDMSIRGYTPDIAIVWMGFNDFSDSVGMGTWKPSDAIPAEGVINTFREAYALMLNKIHVRYPACRIFCCTLFDNNSNGWPQNNGNGVARYDINSAIREIADALGCDTIDFNAAGYNYISLPLYNTSGHPNAMGMEWLGRKAAAQLLAKY